MSERERESKKERDHSSHKGSLHTGVCLYLLCLSLAGESGHVKQQMGTSTAKKEHTGMILRRTLNRHH